MDTLYRLVQTERGVDREEIEVSPVEGIITQAGLSNERTYRNGPSLSLKLSTDENNHYVLFDASFRVDVGERVRAFPLEKSHPNSDFRRTMGLQILAEDGTEKFRYEGCDHQFEYKIMSPDEEF